MSGAFRTPRLDGEAIRFLVIGDSGIGSEAQALIGARVAEERDVASVLHAVPLLLSLGQRQRPIQ